MKRIGGNRRKTRSVLRKRVYEKGKFYSEDYLKTLSNGDKVVLKAEPSFHKSMFNLRFQGKTGQVIEKQGICYKVQIKDGKKLKEIVTHPIHLKRV